MKRQPKRRSSLLGVKVSRRDSGRPVVAFQVLSSVLAVAFSVFVASSDIFSRFGPSNWISSSHFLIESLGAAAVTAIAAKLAYDAIIAIKVRQADEETIKRVNGYEGEPK
jgi:protein-S-isoprenylcysteine O-methyltransferase Ste14